jgi:hypothetical protein
MDILRSQVRQHGTALVKYKTIAAPVFAAAPFEIIQDAPLQLVRIAETFGTHERHGLFTSDAARAKRDNCLVP